MTTSTCSASANGLPDRRHFLSTIAGVGAIGVTAMPALPAIAAAPGIADAHLFDLGRRWEDAKALAVEADRQLDEVAAVYDRAWPHREPEALYVRPDDDLALRTWPEMMKGKPTGRHVYGPKDIEAAEAALAELPEHGLPFGNDARGRAKLERLREIVESRRSQRETRRAAWHATGMEAAERASGTANDRCRELRWQIAQCPAATIAGVLLKLRIVANCFGDTPEEIEAVFDEQIDSGSGEDMALSIARDLIRISGRNAAGGLHA